MEKGKIMMIIIIVLLVVLLGTVAAVSVYVLSLINEQNVAQEEGTDGVTSVKALTVDEKTLVLLGETITTNLLPDEDGKVHIASIHVQVSIDNTTDESEAFITLFNANIAAARFIALDIISNRTADELNATDGKAYLSDLIKTRLQEEFNSMLIVDVTFYDWLIP